MFSWSYKLPEAKIALIQNMAMSIEDSRDMVSAELKKLLPEWDSSKFDKKRHNVRSLNLASTSNFQAQTISIQIVDNAEKVLLTTEIARINAGTKRPDRVTVSPPMGPNGLKFFSFVYSSASPGVSYNISVIAPDGNSARNIITTMAVWLLIR